MVAAAWCGARASESVAAYRRETSQPVASRATATPHEPKGRLGVGQQVGDCYCLNAAVLVLDLAVCLSSVPAQPPGPVAQRSLCHAEREAGRRHQQPPCVKAFSVGPVAHQRRERAPCESNHRSEWNLPPASSRL